MSDWLNYINIKWMTKVTLTVDDHEYSFPSSIGVRSIHSMRYVFSDDVDYAGKIAMVILPLRSDV